MRILDLKVEGFRSLKSTGWRPGDLNVVIGPNASGKSNLLNLLEMICASAQGGLGKHVQSQGGIEPLLWDGAYESTAFELTISPVEKGPGGANARYGLEIKREAQRSSYFVSNEFLEFSDTATNIANLKRDSENFTLLEETGSKGNKKVPSKMETVFSLFKGPLLAKSFIPPYQEAISSWGIYQHFDTGPKASVRQSAVSRYEIRVAWDAENLVQVLHTLYSENRDFKRDFDLAMQAAFSEEFEELTFPPVASNRIELRVRWRSLKNARPSVDLSDGTLRFMYLITILADPNPPPLIAIDEPETGLHPRMLPIVAEYAASAALRTQVILTTHSAEFLDAFRDNPPTTTVAELVNGETKLRVLPREELDYWLREYTLGDIYRSGQLESAE